MIKAVAWDIDGTLVDSEPLHLLVLQDVCRAFEVDISDLNDAQFVGVHVGDVWRALRPRFPSDMTFEKWSRQINSGFSNNRGSLVEIPGALDTITRLAGMGLRQVAVSNSNREIVDANLDAIGVTEFMEFSISLDDVCEGKPDPFPYRLACSRLGLDPGEVLAVEDSATGVESANRAGLQVAFLHRAPDQGTERARAIRALPDVLAMVG